MPWDEQNSRDRVAAHLESMGEIEIEDLAREADLEKLLTETRCRRIQGAHVYAEISNFPRIVSTATGDELKRAVRALHIFQKRAASIVEKLFDGVFVHFQGPRMHALFYRPYEDASIAARAVLLQLVLDDFVSTEFNPRFEAIADFRIVSGSDIGKAVGTRNGVNGDRELLFVGDPANNAAKILAGRRRAIVTGDIADALPADLAAYVENPDDEDAPRLVSCSAAELTALLETHGIAYDAEKQGEMIDEDVEGIKLKDVGVSGAREPIDMDALSVRDNKLVLAATVYSDMDGFTRFVADAADDEDDTKGALRFFAAARKELARIVETDYAALRIQYQGDRTQAMVHLPQDDAKEIAERAVSVAAAHQSAFEITLKDALPQGKALKLAVGIDMGTTLVTKLGARGQRDRICVGQPVDGAARIQEKCDGDEVGISSAVHAAIRESWQKLFKYDDKRRFYVAKKLRARQLQLAIVSESFTTGMHISSGAATVVATTAATGSRPATSSRSWSR